MTYSGIKKKLLFVSLMALFLMLSLSICVGASTIYKTESGEELFKYEADSSGIITSYTGNFPKTDNSNNALTWYVKTTGKDEDGNTVKTVASVLTTDPAHFTVTDGTYSYKGSTVTQYNVVSVNFPSNSGITKLGVSNEGYRTGGTYSYSPSNTELLFLHLPETLTELPKRIGQGSKIIECTMPDSMPITFISKVAFYQAKSLRKINIPATVETIEEGDGQSNGAAFYYCVSLEEVTFAPNSVLNSIGSFTFQYSGLKNITIPDCVESIGNHAFSYTKLINSPFTKSSRLKSLGGRAFGDITTLKNFIVPATLTDVTIYGNNELDYGPLAQCTGIELVTFGDSAPITELASSFFGRATIEKIVLPNGPTTIPDRYFMSAKLKDVTFSDSIQYAGERVFQYASVEVIRLGANFKHFVNSETNHHSFTNACTNLKEIYIPASFYAVEPQTVYQISYAFSCGNSSDVKFFYTGTSDQLATSITNFKTGTMATTENWKFLGATQISWTNYSANPDNYASGRYIIYDYNPCDAFYEGTHNPVSDGEISVCSRCSTVIYCTNPEHNISVNISYDSYLSEGEKSTKCLDCNSTTVKTKVPALFGCLGYSAPENGTCGIVMGYTVNHQAITEYEEATGKTLKYGVFVVSKEKLAENDIFDENGTAANGVVSAKITTNHVAFQLKIVGFETDKQKSAELAMGAYVTVTDGETTEYSYMQGATPAVNEKYHFVSYNSVVSKTTDTNGEA